MGSFMWYTRPGNSSGSYCERIDDGNLTQRYPRATPAVALAGALAGALAATLAATLAVTIAANVATQPYSGI